MIRKTIIIILAGAFSCAFGVNAMALSMELAGGAGVYTLNVTSYKEARFKTVIKQQYDYSCGSAALASLLTYHYENPVDERTVFKAMYDIGNQEKIQREGFSLLDMKRYLDNHGYSADGFRTSLDKLAKVGIPAITLINHDGYMHFVLIKGVSDQYVLVGDPSLGVKLLRRNEFESMWNGGILFLIRSKKDIAQEHFNTEQEWGLTAAAPLDMGRVMNQNTLADINMMLPASSDF